ncbi:ABC transporter substrate-binding protein [Schumannella luteola]|uniref:Peptide/nickel transport system substrate-binding protein n=1 Tax=Schumannella luteola TaxID=472059 RepID=A0A852YHL5_9MICO|nr:peptide/nickel transport system substrate-binding protein [Schumannella luteola]
MKRSMLAKLAAAVTAAATLAVLSGCSGGGASSGDVLTIGMPNGPQSNNSNPFAPTSSAVVLGYRGMMYEPLAQINPTLPDRDPVPWLAKEWKWSDDYKSVEITARDGVKWSDGEKFTADDIAYTFKMLEKYEAFNANALPFDDISVSGDTVKLSFDVPEFVNQTKVINQFIVPEHIWSKIKDPEKDANQKPVGTGPYTLKTWTQQAISFVPNNDYWGGKPKVPEVRWTSYTDNNAMLTALLNGQAQWSYVFIPDIDKTWVAKSETNKNWQPTGLGIDALFFNTTKAPFDNVAVRKAVNMVVDRKSINTQGYSGFKGLVDNVNGLPSPAGDSFAAPEFKDKKAEIDVDGAKKVLTDAGYTYSGDKLMDPSGNPVTFTLVDPAGWSDYLASLQIISDNVKKIGIDAKVETATVDNWTAAVQNGDFQATLHWTNTGATPWDIYSNIMDGTQLKPIGTTANWNFGRFDSPEATQALAAYANTTDDAERTTAMNTLQKIFVEQVPAIPVAAGPMGAEYSTKHFTGWPDEKDPYAVSQPTQPSISQVLMKLEPVKK